MTTIGGSGNESLEEKGCMTLCAGASSVTTTEGIGVKGMSCIPSPEGVHDIVRW